MASPVLAATNFSNQTSSGGTTHTVNLPATANAGDTLFVVFGWVTIGNTITFPAGWTKYGQVQGATLGGLVFAVKKAVGNEGGTTISVTTSLGSKTTHTSGRVTGAADPDVTAPAVGTGTTAATGANPDPPNVGSLASADYLAIAAACHVGEGVFTADPTGYGTLVQADTGTAGANTVNCDTAMSEKAFTGTAEDPGTFTYSTSTEPWVANTLVFHPAGAATQSLTGTLFTSAPTFFTGAVTTGPVALTGSLFASTPTFFAGVLSQAGGTQTLTGSLFTNVPTFNVGVVTVGYVGGLPAAAVIAVWDARTLTGADTDPVASWPDIGPLTQNPLAQATSGFRPLIDDSGFGGIRSVVFDGVDNRLDTTLDQSYTGDFAIIAVLELLTYPVSDSVVLYSTGSNTDKNILGLDTGNNPPGWVVMSAPVGSGANHHFGSVLDLSDVPARVVMTQLVRNAGIHKLWERAVLVVNETESAGGDDLNNMGALKVGARENNDRFAHIRVAYLLLVDMADTDEATLLLARDALGAQFAVPDMDSQALFGTLFTSTPTFNAGTVTAGPVALTGTLYVNAPTFFAGTVSQGSGLQTLTGTLYVNAATFPAGAMTAIYALTGNLHTSTPTFGTGTVTAGTVALTGTLFQSSPTFPQGVVAAAGTVTLTGTLFTSTSTFPTGTVTAGTVALTGNLFTSPPTFPAGSVAASYSLDGSLHLSVPTFPAGTLTAEITVDGNLFVNTATFFQGILAPAGGLFGTLYVNTPTFFTGTLTVAVPPFWTVNPVAYTVAAVSHAKAPVAYTAIGGNAPSPWGATLSGDRLEAVPLFPVGTVS